MLFGRRVPPGLHFWRVSAAGEIKLPSSTLGIIRIRAPIEDVQNARSLLDRYDDPRLSQFAVRVPVPKSP